MFLRSHITALAITSVLLLVPPPALADGLASDPISYPFRGAVRHLIVAGQSHEASYDRDRDFGDWIEQGAGCDTRAVVLRTESRIPVTQNENCTIEAGKWRSYYDATVHTEASDLQIDHVVPVKNVWITGAWQWTRDTRVAYYNDLDDPRTLVAVDSHNNASKSDRTPDDWLPPSHRCRYMREFVSVKLRWSLTVTKPEKRALRLGAKSCRNVDVPYELATIALR